MGVDGQLTELKVTLNKTQRKLNLLCSWLHLKFGDDMSFPRSLYHDHDDSTNLTTTSHSKQSMLALADLVPKTEPEEILPDPLQDDSPHPDQYHDDDAIIGDFSATHSSETLASPRLSTGLDFKISKMTKTKTCSKVTSPSKNKKKVEEAEHEAIIRGISVPSVVTSINLEKADVNVPPVSVGVGNQRTTTRFVRILPRVGEDSEEADGKTMVLKLAEVLPQLKCRNFVLVPANQLNKVAKSSVSGSSFGRKQSTVVMPPKNPPCITIDDEDDAAPGVSTTPTPRKNPRSTICSKCNVPVSKVAMGRHRRLFCNKASSETGAEAEPLQTSHIQGVESPASGCGSKAQGASAIPHTGSGSGPRAELGAEETKGCRLDDILRLSRKRKPPSPPPPADSSATILVSKPSRKTSSGILRTKKKIQSQDK